MRKHLWVAAGLALAVAGCATVEGYQQHMDLIVGHTTDQLKLDWGVPDNIAPLNNGSEMWVYHRTTVSHFGNSYDQVPNGSYTQSYTDKHGNKKTRTVTTYQSVYVPPSTTETHCETRFVIGPDQTVKQVTFEGDGCVAEEIEQSHSQS